MGIVLDADITTARGRVIGWGPVAAAVVAGLFAGLSWAPRWDVDPLLGVLYVLDVASFATTGAFLLTDGRTGRLGWGMLGASFCYAVSWWWVWPSSWQLGPVPIISFVLGYGWFVVGGLALVRYPEPALGRRHEQLYFAALATWVFGGKLVVATFSRPDWIRWNAHAWWPTIDADRHLYRLTSSIVGAGITVLALLLPVLLLYRVRRSRGLERMDMLPATAASVSIGVVGGLYLIAVQLHLRGHLTDGLRAVSTLAALVAPIAFIVSLTQRRLKSGLGEAEIGLLSRCETIEDVETALRLVLDDDTLVLALRSGSSTSYFAPSGYPMPPSEDTRWQVEVPGSSGGSIAVLLVDPTLRRREHAVRAAAVACGIALNDGVLQRDLTRKLSQSQRSRQRLTRDSLNELQRIGHELHDGVNSTLHAVQAHLTRVRVHLRSQQAGLDRGAEVGRALDDAQATVKVAVDELRDLARGIHPEVIEEGLRPALQRKFGRVSTPITLTIDERRTRPEIELMLYLLISEAVGNALRHADAGHVRVVTTLAGGLATATVSDDGCGGAHDEPGPGLAALRERMRALRGELTVTSEPGEGTIVEGAIPCE